MKINVFFVLLIYMQLLLSKIQKSLKAILEKPLQLLLQVSALINLKKKVLRVHLSKAHEKTVRTAIQAQTTISGGSDAVEM